MKTKYSSFNIQNHALSEVKKEVEKLMGKAADIGRPFPRFEKEMAADKKGTFSLLECRGNKSLLEGELDKKEIGGNLADFQAQGERVKTSEFLRTFCKVCGRDISHQKKGSKYCSEKYFGKDGKRCRNKASGQARTERRRKLRAQQKKQS